MGHLFASLSHAVEGAPALALAASVLWGVLSVLLSPCHLASIPLVVAFVSEQRPGSARQAFWTSLLFSTGILLSIALIGVITAAAGRILGDIGSSGTWLVAILLFLVGLHLMGVLPAPWSGPGHVGLKRKGAVAAFILGLVFGIALGPCTFAYMAPMLGIAFKISSGSPVYGAGLLLAYGVGHCAVIVLAGTFTSVVQRFLDWNEHSRGLRVVKFVCGVLLLIGGLWFIYASS